MKEIKIDSIKKELLDIYAAICDLTDSEILRGPENIFGSYFDRLQRLIAKDVEDHLADELFWGHNRGHNRDVYDFMRLAQSIQTDFPFQSFDLSGRNDS